MRIFILLGHPDAASFNGRIADAYEAAARAAGHEVRRQDVGALAFDPILRRGHRDPPPVEPDVAAAQQALMWCERFVLVYPMWWGGMPALLKGWIDRVLMPGFAFRYHDADPWWDRHLAGRTAHIISTCDCPVLYARWRYRDCDFTGLRHAILGFCGMRTARTKRIGRVKFLDAAAREGALAGVARMARR
ncbi:NAD(P)H-dependent oxidoreductase [Sphingobium lignivorans]|uniref:NADPH-quinone reductase n=1 Tax=Sphingobium lignivorans TaxID=2735886 RepID=A0ABR6NB15_9SPHN|nr:NAD(P)H-dependent oxidoreductase [Sphingobium lignivorans]MBB5984465.1 putative NADPH-quinone reductase [Sphingobium lignivorans]